MNKRGGFTLVELLAALAVFGLAAGSLAAALGQGVRAWERGRRASDLQQEARVLLGRVARELRNAVPAPGGGLKGGEKELSFYTARDFTVEGPEPWNAVEVALVGYRLTQGSVERTQRGFPGEGGEGTPRRMTSFPADVWFQYPYAADDADSPVRWENSWSNPGAFPAAVRARLVLTDPDDPERPVEFVKILPVPTGVLPRWEEP